MATSKDFLNYFSELIKPLGSVTFRPMMGEYLMYYNGKLIGDICDNKIFIKPVDAAKILMPEADMQPPYKGAKEMLILDNFEDVDFVEKLFKEIYPQLTEPKKKKSKQ